MDKSPAPKMSAVQWFHCSHILCILIVFVLAHQLPCVNAGGLALLEPGLLSPMMTSFSGGS